MADEDCMEGYDPVAAGEQAEDGTDLEGIRYNLTLTLEQRIERHRCALESLIWMRGLKRVPGPTPNRPAP